MEGERVQERDSNNAGGRGGGDPPPTTVREYLVELSSTRHHVLRRDKRVEVREIAR